MKKITITVLFTSIAFFSNAQWLYNAANIYNDNFGYVGIGTSAPRRQLEVRNSALISPSVTASGFYLDGENLSPTDGWSNVRLIAGSGAGSGWLKSHLDNHGGYFSWTVNRAGNVTDELMRMNADNGNLGIGTINPQARLDVRGGAITNRMTPNATGAFMEGTADGNAYFGSLGGGTVSLGNSTAWQVLNVVQNGNVGIGTTVPKYKLAVNGDIGAKKVKVTQDNWPDYVFESNYQLPSLKEVEQYILRNKHLPGVNSAAEVKEQGLDLGDNQSALLKKIEELTLYAIAQDKKISTQQEEFNKLNEEVNVLRKKVSEIDALKAALLELKKAMASEKE